VNFLSENSYPLPGEKNRKNFVGKLVRLVNICSKSSQGVGADEKHLAANKARSELLSGDSQPLLS
jgi:hypothetical protein